MKLKGSCINRVTCLLNALSDDPRLKPHQAASSLTHPVPPAPGLGYTARLGRPGQHLPSGKFADLTTQEGRIHRPSNNSGRRSSPLSSESSPLSSESSPPQPLSFLCSQQVAGTTFPHPHQKELRGVGVVMVVIIISTLQTGPSGGPRWRPHPRATQVSRSALPSQGLWLEGGAAGPAWLSPLSCPKA